MHMHNMSVCIDELLCLYVSYCVCIGDSVFGFIRMYVNYCECLCMWCVCNYIDLWLCVLHLMWESVLML